MNSDEFQKRLESLESKIAHLDGEVQGVQSILREELETVADRRGLINDALTGLSSGLGKLAEQVASIHHSQSNFERYFKETRIFALASFMFTVITVFVALNYGGGGG